MSFESFELSNPLVRKLLISLGVIILNYIVVFLIIRWINKKIEDAKRRHYSRRWTYYLALVVTIIILAFIWLQRTVSLTTLFGFTSAGLALSLHQVLLNIAGWILIILRRPFGLGDRIEWDSVQGDVIDIRVFYTTLLEVGNWVEADQSTGRVVHIPNSNIFKGPLYNYTGGFGALWNETKFMVSFESNWEKAKEIILKTAYEEREKGLEDRVRSKMRKMAKNYMIKHGKLTPITYVDIKESGVQITLRHLTSARQRRGVQHKISEIILKKFSKEDDIELAYPTRRVYRRNEEGL